MLKRLRKAISDRRARTRQLQDQLVKEERAGRWRRRRTEFLRNRNVEKFRESRRRLRQQRAKVAALRGKVRASQAKLADWVRKYRAARAAAQPLRLRALHVAGTLVGVMEQGGNNVGPMVSKIIRENGGTPGEPWCGDFVAFCYRHAGSKTVERSWAAAWAVGSRAIISSPQPGDVVQYTFQHTGIFVQDLGNGYIKVIEGNTGSSGAVSDSTTGGDGVYVKVRSKSLVKRYVRVRR